jgi:hypothetical protein
MAVVVFGRPVRGGCVDRLGIINVGYCERQAADRVIARVRIGLDRLRMKGTAEGQQLNQEGGVECKDRKWSVYSGQREKKDDMLKTMGKRKEKMMKKGHVLDDCR